LVASRQNNLTKPLQTIAGDRLVIGDGGQDRDIEFAQAEALVAYIRRRLMGVEDSAYYQTFKHLNAKIIKPAVTEVNKVSDIIVTPETRKQGRAVTDIRFRIRRNPQLAILDIDDGAAVRHGET